MKGVLVWSGHMLVTLAGLWLAWRLWSIRIVRVRWLGTVVASTAAAACLSFVSEPPRVFEDFLSSYYLAGRAVRAGPEGFTELLNSGVHGFVNLPIVAYVFAPLGALDPETAAQVFLVVGLVATIGAWALSVRVGRLDASAAAMLLFLFAVNGPLHNSIKEGNTSHIVLMLLAGALVALQRNRHLSAGILLGLAGIVKLPLLLLGVYFAARRYWRVLLGGTATCFCVACASVLVFGWDAHVMWYRLCIEPFSGNPIPAFNVQSVQAAIARFEVGYSGLHDWDPYTLSSRGRLAALVVVALVYALVVGVMVASHFPRSLRRGAVPEPVDIDFMIVVALACLTSPLSWSHYYAWLLLAAAVLWGKLPLLSVRPVWKAVALGAFVLLSLPIVDIRFDSYLFDEVYARFPVSNLVLGGLLALCLLLKARVVVTEFTAEGIAQAQPKGR